MTIPFYKVEIQTLNSDGTYNTAVDITDYVLLGRVGNISQSVDAGDYDIGLYVYSDVTIVLSNFNGLFSSEKFGSSMFHFTRDRAKVEIIFEEGSEYISFKGIINDEATREDFNNGTVSLKVLSQDSILRKTKVSGGVIADGNTLSEAIKSILNLPSITSVLGYDAGKISVGVDVEIDDASVFTDKSTKEVLGLLLNASGSIFRIDSNNDMVVATRAANAVSNLLLYGNDLAGRDNIIEIKNYNEGLQRAFNVITVNGQTSTDEDFVGEYGARIKEFDFDFITTTSKAQEIGSYLLEQFKTPKRELEVTVAVSTAKEIEVLDPVTVSYSRQYIGWENNKIPLYGTALYGADVYPFAGSKGANISNAIDWKVTQIKKDTNKFETILRLREA